MEHNYDFKSFEEAAATFPLILHTKQYKQHVAKVCSKRFFGSYFDRCFKQHRVSNPIAPNQADILPWIFYDRNTTGAGVNSLAQYTFFNVPIGTGGKVQADTNLTQVSRLNDPQWFNCTALGFYFTSNMVKADIDGLLNAYYHQFTIGDKIYATGPLQCFPGGAGLQGVDTRNNEGTYSNGQANLGNVYDLRLPAGLQLGVDASSGVPIVADGLIGQTILQGQNFNDQVIGTPFALSAAAAPNNGVGLNFMCFLYGILSRGVQ